MIAIGLPSKWKELFLYEEPLVPCAECDALSC